MSQQTDWPSAAWHRPDMNTGCWWELCWPGAGFAAFCLTAGTFRAGGLARANQTRTRTSARSVAGRVGANGLANQTHTRSCWKAGRVARGRFAATRDTAGWLTAFLAPAGTRQTDAISEVATMWACGDGGHSWNGRGVSRTTAVCHGANCAGALHTLYPRQLAHRGFYSPSLGVLGRQRASFLVIVSARLHTNI